MSTHYYQAKYHCMPHPTLNQANSRHMKMPFLLGQMRKFKVDNFACTVL